MPGKAVNLTGGTRNGVAHPTNLKHADLPEMVPEGRVIAWDS